MPDEINKPTYRDKIDALLGKVSKGEPAFPKDPEPVVIPENPTYKRMKELGGIQKGLPEFFKIDESAFDVPHFIKDDAETQIVGSHLFYVVPPSSHTDADEYWNKMLPHLKRIGKSATPHDDAHGMLNIEVISKDGEPEILRICLVRDEEHGDRPTLIFQYLNRDDITPEEVIKFVTNCGLKIDRLSTRQFKGVIVSDVTDK